MKKCEAVIGSYLGIVETDSSYYFQTDPKSTRRIEGYVFGNYVISLKENKKYYILKRDKNGVLEDSELKRIKPNVEYVFKVEEKIQLNEKNKVKSIMRTKR